MPNDIAPPAAAAAEPEWFPGTVGTHFAGKPLAEHLAAQIKRMDALRAENAADHRPSFVAMLGAVPGQEAA